MAEGGMAEGGVAEGGMAEGGVAEGGVAEGGVAEGGVAPAEADQHASLTQAGIQLTVPERVDDLEMKIAKELAAVDARIGDLKRAECRRAEELEISSNALRENLAENLDMKERILQQKVERSLKNDRRNLDSTLEEMRQNFRHSTKLISVNEKSIHDLVDQFKERITENQEELKNVYQVMINLKEYFQQEIQDIKNKLERDIDRHSQIISERIRSTEERVKALERESVLMSETSRGLREEMLAENASTRNLAHLLVHSASEKHEQQMSEMKEMMQNFSQQFAEEKEGQKQRFIRLRKEMKFDIGAVSKTLGNYRKSFDRLNNAVNASSPLLAVAPDEPCEGRKNKASKKRDGRAVVIGSPTDFRHQLHVEEENLQEWNFLEFAETFRFGDKDSDKDSEKNPRKRDRSATNRQKRQS